MKKNLWIAIRLTAVLLLICGGIFPLLISFVGRWADGGGKGVTLSHKGRVVGYEKVGQSFTDDKYFWGRPSAVGYQASGSGGSNKGPSNPDYLAVVQERIDTFLAHNPGVQKKDIPADLVTASGSGLDPHISPAAARIQVKRIAAIRGISESTLFELIEKNTEKIPLGPNGVHVLKLNIALDELK